MLFGHSDKVEIFKRLLEEDRLHHAYLFFGDVQIGKRTFAEHLAYFLEYGEFKILEGPLIDSRVFQRAVHKQSFGIDDALEVRRFLYATPFHSKKRLAIIDEAEMLTPEAESALLKVVEEPPASALIIFIAYDPQLLLPPLRSRLTRIYFARLPEKKIRHILQDDFGIDPERATAAALQSFGRIGRTIELVKPSLNLKKEKTFTDELEEQILKYHKSGVVQNTHILKVLLRQETLVKRFNLNENLQRKAIEYVITNQPRINFANDH